MAIKSNPAEYMGRVEKGVRYLDRRLGRKNWLPKIDIINFDMENSSTCICGQIFGNFWDSIIGSNKPIENAMSMQQSFDRGFVDYVESDDKRECDYDLLHAAWTVKLADLKYKMR